MSQMCAWCAQACTPTHPRQITCSHACAKRLRVQKGLRVTDVRMCAWCAQSFVSQVWNEKTCSDRCYRARHNRQCVASHRRRHPPKRGPEWASGPKARSQRYYVKNRKKRLADNKAWREANPEKELARHNRYNHAHPEWVSLRNTRRRIRKKNGVTGDLTPAEARAVKVAAKGRCYYCKQRVKQLTLDHITPVTKDGPNTVQNVIAVCLGCNQKKRVGPPPIPVQPFLVVEVS